MREVIILFIPKDTDSGFFAVAGIVIGLALLVGMLAGAFPWLVTPLCWLICVLDEVKWGWFAVTVFLGLMAITQLIIGKGEKRISLVKLAMVAAFVLGLVLTAAAAIAEAVSVESALEWLLLPVVATIMGFILFPLVYMLTTATSLVVLPWNVCYTLRGLCSFFSFLGLLMAFQAVGELVCGKKVLDMVRLEFTGRFLLLNVSDEARAMAFGSSIADGLALMGVEIRLLVFGAIGGLSLWGEHVLAQ